MRKGWDDALELQNALHHAAKTEEFASYLHWYGQGAGRVASNSRPGVQQDLAGGALYSMAKLTAALAIEDDAPPMWVNNGVIDLVEYASESFQPESIIPEDLLVPKAFCVFERALYAQDIEGRRISFRGASWGESNGYLLIGLWHHKNDKDDAYASKFPDTYGRSIGGSPLILMQTSAAKWGDLKALSAPQVALWRQLQVLWRLSKQHVTVTGQHQVSRPVWRHKQNWREIKTVQVMMLRRSLQKHFEGEPTGRHYSHRFPVRPHWRNQWYPSVKEHRQIWIDGFVKGPEDAPFVAKRQAVEFIR